jgi:hypothetical protein
MFFLTVSKPPEHPDWLSDPFPQKPKLHKKEADVLIY